MASASRSSEPAAASPSPTPTHILRDRHVAVISQALVQQLSPRHHVWEGNKDAALESTTDGLVQQVRSATRVWSGGKTHVMRVWWSKSGARKRTRQL